MTKTLNTKLKFYNSLTRRLEEFKPINPPKVGMYTCGQTVYDYTHIGHGRKYVNDDLLRRNLTYFGYQVTHVQNVTDVGHLVSDADIGEDKLEKGAKKFGKTVFEVAKFFTKHFYDSLDKLNVLRPTIICQATKHIPEQINLIKQLINKGFAYDTQEAVYFEVSKFKDYDKLFGQKLEDKLTAVRSEVQKGEHKRSSLDFVLWFKRVGRFSNHQMHWPSPWGEGFPGWHIECSAMSMKYLGEQLDIHTGGEDHLSIHHPNEIAQSEGASGKKPFVKYWIHHAFLKVEGKKMSKSLENFIRVEELEDKGFDPLALRYLFLTTHYRKVMNFTWEALEACQKSLTKLRKYLRQMTKDKKEEKRSSEGIKLQHSFEKAIADDLNFPQALAIVWEVVKSKIKDQEKHQLLLSFDKVLGLDLKVPAKDWSASGGKSEKLKININIKQLINKREELRKLGKWEEADKIRMEIEKQGYQLHDTGKKTEIRLVKTY